jgi:hypothetical protein
LARECMVDDAVQRKPVSGLNSLLTGKNTGKFAQFAPQRWLFRQNETQSRALLTLYPKIENRELCRREQGKLIQDQGISQPLPFRVMSASWSEADIL